MRHWKSALLIVLLVLISAPSLISHAVQTNTPTPLLEDRGVAPELTNTVWINAGQPLRLADLRGQVVLLDFWTVDCINCYHTQPYLRAVYNKFNGKGVQIIGIHFPEFPYERDAAYVQDYMARNGLKYPVAIDNDGASWYAYEMHAYPALELIDKNGYRQFRLIGEGDYNRITAAITALLAEPYSAATPAATDAATLLPTFVPTLTPAA